MSSPLRSLYVLSFLLFLGSGLFAALFHIFPPLQPFAAISLLNYRSMAPFQAFERENGELIAEGLSGKVWTPIPLEPYLPLPQGERSAWFDLWSLALLRSLPQEDPGRTPGYRRMAELLLLQEQKKGNSLSTLRLSLETWPASLEGYSALRHHPFFQRTLLIQVP